MISMFLDMANAGTATIIPIIPPTFAPNNKAKIIVTGPKFTFLPTTNG